MTKTTTYKGKEYDSSHGSPFDRGSADFYYRRNPKPHMWLDSHGGNQIELSDPQQVEAYMAGYAEAKEFGEQKNWWY